MHGLFRGPLYFELSRAITLLVLVPRDGEATCFIHFFNHQPYAKAQSIISDVLVWPSPIPTLVEEIRRKALAKCRIGLVTLRGIPYGHVTELKRLLLEADLVEFGPSFNRIRSVARRNESTSGAADS